MRMRGSLSLWMVLTGLLVLTGGVAFSQDAKLAVSAKTPVVDGVVKADEYSFTKDLGQAQISLSQSADTLWIGVVGTTTGWVAVGLTSLKMDGSAIFMGFVDPAGAVQFKPQVGAGHGHKDTTEKQVTDSILSSAMKEEGGKTSLEIALKADRWIKSDQASLKLIYAIGSQDSFTPWHTARGSMTVVLAQ
jgi:hypothetical protein